MNEALNLLFERASTRSFRPDPVEKEKLDLIVKAGCKAPSGMNLQTPLFLVATKPETVKKLSALNAAVMGSKDDPFYGAPAVIAVLVRKECCWQYDGSLAMGNMLNAAYSLGIGSCWIHRCKQVFESAEGKEILASLGITDDVEGVGFCILGYAESQPAAKEIKPGRVFYMD